MAKRAVASSVESTRSSLRRLALALALLGVVGCGTATLLGSLGRSYWLFDLLSHFRLQYAAVLIVDAAMLAALRSWRWMLGAAAVLVFNLALILPLYWGSPSPHDASRPQLDVVAFNVNYNNGRHDELADYLIGRDADVLVVLEATAEFAASLQSRMPEHTMIGRGRSDAFGMVLLTRLPLDSHELLYFADSELPAIAVELVKGGSHFSLLALHTMPPVGADNAKLRDRMLKEAAKWARSATNPIIIGDLNATSWSFAFADLLERGRLQNSQKGFGLQTSWPNALWPLSITIDHCVHGRALTTVARSVGPFLGSDHRPLHVTLGFDGP